MTIRIVRLGSERSPKEGVRIGTVRRCADESRCHRSVLRELLVEFGAAVEAS